MDLSRIVSGDISYVDLTSEHPATIDPAIATIDPAIAAIGTAIAALGPAIAAIDPATATIDPTTATIDPGTAYEIRDSDSTPEGSLDENMEEDLAGNSESSEESVNSDSENPGQDAGRDPENPRDGHPQNPRDGLPQNPRDGDPQNPRDRGPENPRDIGNPIAVSRNSDEVIEYYGYEDESSEERGCNVLNEDKLSCRICWNIMVAEIYNCCNGHSICKECLASCPNCPTCRAPMSGGRNFQLEDLIKEVLYCHQLACSFARYGCTFGGRHVELERHENNCSFRKVSCFYKKNGCKVSKRAFELEAHEVQCPFVLEKCVYSSFGCNQVLTRIQIRGHEIICPYKRQQQNLNYGGISYQVRLQNTPIAHSTVQRPYLFPMCQCCNLHLMRQNAAPIFPCSQFTSQYVGSPVQNIVPSTQVIQPSSQGIQPSSQNIRPSTQVFPPSSQGIRPSTQNIRPSSQVFPPSSQIIRPSSQNIRPSSQNVRPSSQNIRPSSQNIPPSSQNIRPSSQNIPPSSQNIRPSSQAIPSSSQGIRPTSQSIRPSSQDIPPRSQTIPPRSQDIRRSSQCVGPTSQSIQQSSQSISQDPALAAPALQCGSPVNYERICPSASQRLQLSQTSLRAPAHLGYTPPTLRTQFLTDIRFDRKATEDFSTTAAPGNNEVVSQEGNIGLRLIPQANTSQDDSQGSRLAHRISENNHRGCDTGHPGKRIRLVENSDGTELYRPGFYQEYKHEQ